MQSTNFALENMPLHPMKYFMSPEDVLRRFAVLADIDRLSQAKERLFGFHAVGDTETLWLNTIRGTIVFTHNPDASTLELFRFDFDEVNSESNLPDFILCRASDDSTWTPLRTVLYESENPIDEFEYMTDVFYCGAADLHDLIFDGLFYAGGNVPDDFTIEKVEEILNSNHSLNFA